MGVTDEETDEVLHLAMSVGATRMQVMLNGERSAATRAAGPPPEAPDQAAPTFQAAEVVAQADSG